MAEASSNNSSSLTCLVIDPRKFDLGCLGPALAIILILAFLKRRKNLQLEYCSGYPGLLIPINFLGTFKDRYTIAATFGATASTCLTLFLTGSDGLIYLGDSPSPWLKVFQGLIGVLVYGIVFYPFFACLTTDYKLVGSLLGFLYAIIRFPLSIAIEFQCQSDVEGDAKKLLYLAFLSRLPTYLCLGFVMIRFAVLLFLEVRKKWFPPTNRINERTEDRTQTCLVGKPEIAHVKHLINPGLNFGAVDIKWYMRLVYCIYQPRSDFKFSTQLISTLVVAGIIVFQIFVVYLSVFDLLKRRLQQTYASDAATRNIFDVLLGSMEAAYIVSALISVMLMLHFMKCHREHVLQLYRGQRTFYQDVFVSPAMLVGRSLRFSGFQIAYILAGYSVLGFFLSFVCLILGFVFKYMKELLSPAMFETIKQLGLAMLPTVFMVVFLWSFQVFLAYFVFRDRDFPNITITVDNRRLFSIMSYFFFFYNILLGVFSCLGRIFKGMILGIFFLSRIDRTSLMQGFQTWDQAFVAYLGFVNVLVAHSHPVMLMFCHLLINRDKDIGLEESLPEIQSIRQNISKEPTSAAEETGIIAGTRPVTTYTAHTRVLRLPRLSQKALNRWHVAVTLLRNPSLIKYRRRGYKAHTVTLGSINADVSALV